MSAEEIIARFDLKPLEIEGGYFRETYRSAELISNDNLSEAYKGERSFSTAIYFLLTPETVSTLHRLPGDEVFHFYYGDTVEMLQLNPDGSGSVKLLGNSLEKNVFPQIVMPSYSWFGARLVDGGKVALMGTTMSPGFDYKDYVIEDKDVILGRYPRFAQWINKLL